MSFFALKNNLTWLDMLFYDQDPFFYINVRRDWHLWFAWHPVRVRTFYFPQGEVTDENPYVKFSKVTKWVWFEKIYRRKMSNSFLDFNTTHYVTFFDFLKYGSMPWVK